MSLQTEARRAPGSGHHPVRALLLALACVSGASLASGCGLVASGACVYGSTAYFCEGSSAGACEEDLCGDYWDACAYYEAMSCEELGFDDESSYLTDYSPPSGADWTNGGFGGGGTSGGGGGGGTAATQGACAYYDNVLNRALCDPYATSSSCSGKFFGVGTSCQGISCTDGSNPYTCTVPGGGGSGGGTGSGGSCDSAWVCQYDAQSATMCSWACTHSGTERTQTCQVLASMVTSGNAGECCTSCR